MITNKYKTTSLSTHQLQQNIIQNYLLMWVDDNLDEEQIDYQIVFKQLYHIVNQVIICRDHEHCIKCLNQMNDGKAFVIISDTLSHDLVPRIHDMEKVQSIYISCRGNNTQYKQWTKEWSKVEDIITGIKSISQSVRKVTRRLDHNEIPMSFISKQAISLVTSSKHSNLNQLEPIFMYSVLFKEIILDIDDEDETKSVKDLLAYCHLHNISEQQLDEFQNEYQKQSPIQLYTKCIFLYRMLNQALRIFETESMIKMSFFIRNLHRQLEKLQKEQMNTYNDKFIVYRGQALSQQDFQRLLDIKGGLLSFNNFLSTSKEREIAMAFAESVLDDDTGFMAVIFIITINIDQVSTLTTPFAIIADYRDFPQEEEVLFSMHTVFRVSDIEQSVTYNHLWEVKLTLTDDNDPQLVDLTKRMKEEIDGKGWNQMGKLMLKVGHFDQAEVLYNELLKSASTNSNKADIYQRLGEIKHWQGQFQEAISLCEISLEINRNSIQENYTCSAASYNSIGLTYCAMGDFSKALDFFEKALHIRENDLFLNHPDSAESCNNIGLVYNNIGDFLKALEFFERACKIWQIALPSNHPSLAISYNNIGGVYEDMGDYSKALEFYEKSRTLLETALLSNHPSLATSYNNIGIIHRNMGYYSKALEFYEKSCKILEMTLPADHLRLATPYDNMGIVYNNMGDYSKALEFYEKTLKILQNTLPSNHPHLAATVSQFGRVHRSLKDYPKALNYFEKCLAIMQESLPEKHPNIAITYSNIGDVHRLMGDYEQALTFHRRALNIQDNITCSLLECADTYVNLGETCHDMQDYKMALLYFRKGLHVREEKLSKDHPDLAIVHHSLAKLYLSTGEYQLAMERVQQAITIGEKKLLSTHPDIVDYRETYETIRKKM